MHALLAKGERFFGWWTLFGLCAIAFSGMLVVSFGDSGTTDELAHIPAGYGYVRHLDYRLNPEHPPLVKALGALPLLFLNLNFPTDHKAWQENVNGQWEMGTEFLYRSGNDANRIIRWSRVFPMLLTIALVVLMYVWARRLMGPLWALVPSFLFAFSPSVLAHGHYVTTDIGAALGIVGGTYYFLSFLKNPSRKSIWLAGIAFGIAQLMKFSVVLLVPFLLFLAVVYSWRLSDGKQFWKTALRQIRNTVLIFSIGFGVVVYPAYGIFTLNYPIEKQVSDTKFILGSFAGGPPPEGVACKPIRCIAELDIVMAGNKITRPLAHYLLGVLMVVQRSAGGNTAYFLGEVSATGSRWYFPLVYALKEPLPVFVLILWALLYGFSRCARAIAKNIRRIAPAFREYLEKNFDGFSMTSFVFLYWAYSIQSPLNIGFRHLFPAIPFMYILSVHAWKQWVLSPIAQERWWSALEHIRVFLREVGITSLRIFLLLFLLLWLALETIVAAPHFLSYFNQLGGGTKFGYRYVTDSNYDWGQDLLRLQTVLKNHPEIQKIAVDYFGAGNPEYYLRNKAEPWRSERGVPLDSDIEWFAISINSLQSALQPTAPGFERKPEDEYPWLKAVHPPVPGMGNVPQPDFRAGTSIFVYKLK